MSWLLALGTTLVVAMPITVAPRVVTVSSEKLDQNASLTSLISEVRGQADAFVFLSGGASRMSPEHQKQLLAMFGGLATVAKSRRIAVGDGGTQAGIMQAAGEARRASGDAFPLVGVAPAGEIPPRGQTPIDPNHSHVIAVDNPAAPAKDAWGSETDTMYWLFGKLAEGRPSVTIVANGGGITLKEIEANIRAGRQMILIEGSGRAADAVASLLAGTTPSDKDVQEMRARAEAAKLASDPKLFVRVPLTSGAKGLSDAILNALGPGK